MYHNVHDSPLRIASGLSLCRNQEDTGESDAQIQLVWAHRQQKAEAEKGSLNWTVIYWNLKDIAFELGKVGNLSIGAFSLFALAVAMLL